MVINLKQNSFGCYKIKVHQLVTFKTYHLFSYKKNKSLYYVIISIFLFDNPEIYFVLDIVLSNILIYNDIHKIENTFQL